MPTTTGNTFRPVQTTEAILISTPIVPGTLYVCTDTQTLWLDASDGTRVDIGAGGDVDLSAFYTKSEINTKVGGVVSVENRINSVTKTQGIKFLVVTQSQYASMSSSEKSVYDFINVAEP